MYFQPRGIAPQPAFEPPAPPTRRASLTQKSNGSAHSSGYNSASSTSGGESFESRFGGRFKTPQFLPPPEPFTGCPKTYPSKAHHSTSGNAVY